MTVDRSSVSTPSLCKTVSTYSSPGSITHSNGLAPLPSPDAVSEVKSPQGRRWEFGQKVIAAISFNSLRTPLQKITRGAETDLAGKVTGFFSRPYRGGPPSNTRVHAEPAGLTGELDAPFVDCSFVESPSPSANKRRAIAASGWTLSRPVASGKTRAFHLVSDKPGAILAVPHRDVDRKVLQSLVNKLDVLERRGFPVVKAHAVQPVGSKFGVLMEYKPGLSPLHEADDKARENARLVLDELTEAGINTSDIKILTFGEEVYISAGKLLADSPADDNLVAPGGVVPNPDRI